MLILRGAIKLSRSEREYSKIDEARDEKEKLRIGEMNLIKRIRRWRGRERREKKIGKGQSTDALDGRSFVLGVLVDVRDRRVTMIGVVVAIRLSSQYYVWVVSVARDGGSEGKGDTVSVIEGALSFRSYIPPRCSSITLPPI